MWRSKSYGDMSAVPKSNRKAEAEQSRKIEAMLRKAQMEENKIVKILLLGGGESGKSTFLKQIRVLHANGFSDADFDYYRNLIYLNVFDSINALIEAMGTLKIPLRNPTNKENVTHFQAHHRKICDGSSKYLTHIEAYLASMIQAIWKDLDIQECYERRSEFNLLESAQYFLDSLDRVADPHFKPSIDDILRSRCETTGIVEMDFTCRNISLKVIDVGGQKSKRKKWIHCFDNVSAILFVTSMSEYDQTLAEDKQVNRMRDSLALFEEISHNCLFHKTSIMLFLNKTDVFNVKIKKTPITVCFPNYKGTNEQAKDFIQSEFLIRAPTEKSIYPFFTCATDSKNFERIFQAVMDMLVKRNVASTGLM